jgi:hypothetical protein
MREDRQFPSSPESEAGILSGLMLDSEAINRVPDLVAEAFHNETHAAIFRAIQSLAVVGRTIVVNEESLWSLCRLNTFLLEETRIRSITIAYQT